MITTVARGASADIPSRGSRRIPSDVSVPFVAAVGGVHFDAAPTLGFATAKVLI